MPLNRRQAPFYEYSHACRHAALGVEIMIGFQSVGECYTDGSFKLREVKQFMFCDGCDGKGLQITSFDDGEG